tara:strand:+ start:64 stop:282 length:219 start_codon:yes stop_codon:yes gene_type:complete
MPKINHEKIALYLEKLVVGWDEELAREMVENMTPEERAHLSRLIDICRDPDYQSLISDYAALNRPEEKPEPA